MTIVVTGGRGFIGANLSLRLRDEGLGDVRVLGRDSSFGEVKSALEAADFVFHFAAANRPTNAVEFQTVNVEFTRRICAILQATGKSTPVLLTSSTQAECDTPYGASKRAAEDIVRHYGERSGSSVYVPRLPNVFGKWARPNYNSAIATFCHNVARGIPINVHNAAAELELVYVDDLTESCIRLLPPHAGSWETPPTYRSTVGAVADLIVSFSDVATSLQVPAAGANLERALYATYLSYLLPRDFCRELALHTDHRGDFAEVLRTPLHGQVAFFTARPGATRGNHYHHTKNERFVVVHGSALFCFQHVLTGERHELTVHGTHPCVVQPPPGWAHSVQNTGDSELVVLLWANEVFDAEHPDTFAYPCTT